RAKLVLSRFGARLRPDHRRIWKDLAVCIAPSDGNAVRYLCDTGRDDLPYIYVPKGFFPVQDTGAILGVSESEQSISFTAMAARQQELARVILQDPDVESLSSFIGIDGTNTTVNSGRMQINLKPHDERKANASDVIRRLQPQLEKVEAITLFMQPVQDITVDDRVSRTQFQYSLEDADAKEL